MLLILLIYLLFSPMIITGAVLGLLFSAFQLGWSIGCDLFRRFMEHTEIWVKRKKP